MKIAVVSEDGIIISRCFGRAPIYVVLTVEDGKIVARETRDKLVHAHFTGEEHAEETQCADSRSHGFDSAAQNRHARMVIAIADCQVLLARGMGASAYKCMKLAGISPILTDLFTIDEAVSAYLAGKIIDHVERLY